jgi:hypothetical protein
MLIEVNYFLHIFSYLYAMPTLNFRLGDSLMTIMGYLVTKLRLLRPDITAPNCYYLNIGVHDVPRDDSTLTFKGMVCHTDVFL